MTESGFRQEPLFLCRALNIGCSEVLTIRCCPKSVILSPKVSKVSCFLTLYFTKRHKNYEQTSLHTIAFISHKVPCNPPKTQNKSLSDTHMPAHCIRRAILILNLTLLFSTFLSPGKLQALLKFANATYIRLKADLHHQTLRHVFLQDIELKSTDPVHRTYGY